MFSLVYVSRSSLVSSGADEQIDAIVATSVERNSPAEITGALLFTGERFAQVLEGSASAVRDLMDCIRKDARHTDIVVIQEGAVPVRRLKAWSMAYSGRSTFAAQIVEQAAAESAQGDDFGTRRLIRLIQELARSSR